VATFVRFQSAVPNRHGRYPGVFALANGLAAEGHLSPADRAWWAATNHRCDELYADPSTADPRCYDPVAHPGARSWFKASAADLLVVAADYLGLLDRYGVPWVELRTASPGRVVYEDDVQVVAVPHSYPDDWPLTSGIRPPVSS
jgi:hypothetical protein